MSQHNNTNEHVAVANVPSKLPSTWFENVAPSEIERLVESARKEAVDAFFKKLDEKSETPTLAEIQAASTILGIELKEQVESIDWIETLCGEETPSDQQGFLKLHLQELLLPPEIPDPTMVRSEVRGVVLCAVAAFGALLGLICGGWIAGLIAKVPVESGLSFGAIIGAALGVALVMFVANNEALRNRILLGLGIVGGIDSVLQIIKGFLPWPTWGKISFLKRLVVYSILAITVFISRREKVYDKNNYRILINAIVVNWLRTALTVIAVLTFKIKSVDNSPFNPSLKDTKTLLNVVATTKKLRQSSDEDIPLVINELVQELETHGFEMIAEENSETKISEQPLIWDESLEERYDAKGIVRKNDAIKIVKEPIIQDGVVKERGVVRKA